jgi:VanZ family protein
LALIFLLSSLSRPPGLSVPDKGAHAALYSVLGALLTRALAGGSNGIGWRTAAIAVLLSALYGVSDEFHQYFVPMRHVEALDVVADTVGAAAGAAAFRAFAPRIGAKRR